MNIIDHNNFMVKEIMEPVIESLADRIDKLEANMADLSLAVANVTAMFPIILDKLKQTEETYNIILKFIKLEEKKSNKLFEKMERARKIDAHKQSLKED